MPNMEALDDQVTSLFEAFTAGKSHLTGRSYVAFVEARDVLFRAAGITHADYVRLCECRGGAEYAA